MFEGAWDASGALCLNKYRAAELVASGELPSCVLQRVSATCTSDTTLGLVRNAYSTLGVTAPVAKISKGATSGSNLQKGCDAALAKTSSAATRIARNTNTQRLKANDDLLAAAQSIAKLVTDGLLDAGFGTELVLRYMSAARELASFMLSIARVSPDAKGCELLRAEADLAAGDSHVAASKWKEAMTSFKSALNRAQEEI